MGELIRYQCENCDFTFLKDKPFLFYFDSEKEKLHEIPGTLLAVNVIKDEMLQGSIYTGYCNHCGEFIKVYVPADKDIIEGKHVYESMKPNPNKELIDEYNLYKDHNTYTKEEVKGIFEKYCKTDPKFYDINFNSPSIDFNNYPCSNCKKSIKIDIDEPFCPKCEEETLKAIRMELID